MSTLNEIKVGQTVVVLPHSRTRTIFNNADCFPGETTHYTGGQIGTVEEIYDNGFAGDSAWVIFGDDSDNGLEFDLSEIKAIEPELL